MSPSRKPLRETVLARRVVKLAEALLEVPDDVLSAMAKDMSAHGEGKAEHLASRILEAAWWEAPSGRKL